MRMGNYSQEFKKSIRSELWEKRSVELGSIGKEFFSCLSAGEEQVLSKIIGF